jgi:hypothetical protein
MVIVAGLPSSLLSVLMVPTYQLVSSSKALATSKLARLKIITLKGMFSTLQARQPVGQTRI